MRRRPPPAQQSFAISSENDVIYDYNSVQTYVYYNYVGITHALKNAQICGVRGMIFK